MRNRAGEVLIKKYSNRRLYDTSESRYITLEELTAIIRSGRDVRIVDAKTNDDLTQITLAQMILESGRAARLLPQPLLIQLVRMSDDALAEFFGRYMTWALELYNQAKSGAAALAPYNPFATLPFAATNALARFWGNAPMWTDGAPGGPPQGPPPSHAAPPEDGPDVDDVPTVDEPTDLPPRAQAGSFDDDTPTDPARRSPAGSKPVSADELAELRSQIEELKRAMLKQS